VNFYRDADILIHDCQYTKEEYFSSKIGWGHSFFEHAIDTAIEAQVKKVILFHHDPSRTDDELLSFQKAYCTRKHGKSSLEVVIAKEGMEMEL